MKNGARYKILQIEDKLHTITDEWKVFLLLNSLSFILLYFPSSSSCPQDFKKELIS
jgi:hypothetical protein